MSENASDQAGDEDDGTALYGELVKAELDAEASRKSSLEQRGLAVITTSGGLVTLLFALGALSTKAAQTFALEDPAPVFLILALAFFVLAAIAALLTNVPMPYEAVTPDGIESRIREDPVRTVVRAERDIALTRIKTLRTAQARNTFKARCLFAAMIMEVIAVAWVSAAIWVVIDP